MGREGGGGGGGGGKGGGVCLFPWFMVFPSFLIAYTSPRISKDRNCRPGTITANRFFTLLYE